MVSRALAQEIDSLYQSFDPYEYMDQDDGSDLVEEILLLMKNDIPTLINSLLDIYPDAIDEDKKTIRHILNQI